MDQKKLLETGDRCIHDEPPACTASCPIHVDVSAFLEEIKKGDFTKAYKILSKRMPLPRLFGLICDHPCTSVCSREQLDCSVNIAELERAAVKYGDSQPKKILSVPKNAGKAAVVGGGISGIVAAAELNKKGFSVTIWEQSGRLGGRIWDYEGKRIDKNTIEEELETIEKLGISVKYHQKIDKNALEQLAREYDAVYLGTGEWIEELKIDPVTFQVENSKIFAGGRLFHHSDSVILSVSTGKRAAISAERFVKKVSLTAAREREGSFETPLKYNLEDVKPAKGIECPPEGYTREEAVREAQRCLSCRCNECVKACSHMKKFQIAPKSYVKQININENVIMGTRYANKMIGACTECGLCAEQCPFGIDMKDIVHQTRESMVEKGKMPPSYHDFALKDMEFSNSSQFFLLKSPPPIPEEKRTEREKELFTYPRLAFSKYAQSVYKGEKPGTEKVDYLFYPGCQLSASSPDYVEKSYQYLLSHIKEGVGLMLGCCGAPADWAGRQDLMKQNVERLKDSWVKMGSPTFILACSSCSQIFEKYLPEIPFVSLWEIIDQYGLPETSQKGGGHTLTIHDACSSRYNEKIQSSVRSIVRKLGYQIDELKYSRKKTKCCGYGGLVYYANRDQANEFVQDRISESKDDFLVYCANCKDLFVEGGKKTYHILDLIFGDDPEQLAQKKKPNLSQRHMNRAQLKKKLLRDLWGEETEAELKNENSLGLVISPEVWDLMEKRYILLEDIQQVVQHAQSTGERFFNPENSNYLASMRIGGVTYWVRYKEQPNGIYVDSVYSHRMEIMKE